MRTELTILLVLITFDFSLLHAHVFVNSFFIIFFDNFEYTKEFNWVKENAHKYGFIMRYPKAKFHITGFKYEPWHYRYVGIDIATYIYENNITLEEYKKNYT